MIISVVSMMIFDDGINRLGGVLSDMVNPIKTRVANATIPLKIKMRMSENFKVKVKIEENFHPYPVPSKNGLGQREWALKLNPEYTLNNVEKDGKNSETTLKEFVHDQLENSLGMEIGQKWKNTLDYLTHLQNGRS